MQTNSLHILHKDNSKKDPILKYLIQLIMSAKLI